MGKRNYTIAVDVDGVLADQISGILPIIIKVQGVMLKYDEVTSWNLPINDTSIDIIIVNEQKKRSYILDKQVSPDSLFPDINFNINSLIDISSV